ncbi:hypothetical protein HJD18_01495 [Thermoleophilia bacterium SCSIO 60948]|nr:hypothetical protein HJD18_01495 [Thermoleophilia bacterium SCSIO 60948]
MAEEVTADRLVEAAEKLGESEFTRDDLAESIGIKKRDFRSGFREARQSGRFEKTRETEDGSGVFKLASK